MASSAVRVVTFALFLQSTCWIGVWAQLHNIITEGGVEGGGHWDYTNGPYGPANWYHLDPGWGACAGRLQSPIQVFPPDMVTDPMLGPVDAYYNLNQNIATIVRSDHDIKVQMPQESGYLNINGDPGTFALDSFHYHMPSEHRILNQTFPLELHLVHVRYIGGQKQYAVVAYLFVNGAESGFLNQLQLPYLHTMIPNTVYAAGTVYLNMPLQKNYGHYVGSLTVPPCTEGVRWIINLWNFPTASTRQLALLQNALLTPGRINNRPAFPSTGRGFRITY